MLIFNFIGKEYGKEYITSAFHRKIDDGEIDYKFVSSTPMGGALWEKIFVKEKLDLKYFIDSNNYEDYYTTYRYVDNCDKIYYTNEVFYYANRDNENSLSKNVDLEKIEKTCYVLEKMKEECNCKFAINQIIFKYYSWGTWYYVQKRNDLNELEKKRIKLTLGKIRKLFRVRNIKISLKDYKLYVKNCIYSLIRLMRG